MAVAYDAGGTTADVLSGTSISNSSLTIGSGANRALVAFFGYNGTSTPVGLTVVWDPGGANQTMTQITSAIINDGITSITLILFGLLSPTSGNKTCTATWTSPSTQEAHLNVAAATGVDQTSVAVAFPNGIGVKTTGASISQNVTSAIGNLAVAAMGQTINFWSTVGPTAINLDGTASSFAMASARGAGAATVTFTGTWGGSAGNNWDFVGCDILAAGGAATPPEGIPPGRIFIPNTRFGPMRGLRPAPAFPPPIITPPEGIPPGTIFVPGKRFGPTRGLRPTQAYPPAPAALLIQAGSYAVAGASINFAQGRTVGSGAYNVTGFPVGLGAGLNVGAGTYTVTGFGVSLDVGMAVSAGSYVYSGDAVTFTYTPAGGNTYTLAIGATTYTATGFAVTLAGGMSVGAGSYVYTGAAVGLGAGINIASASYVYTGASIHFAQARVVGSGAYNVTGLPVGLGAGLNVGAAAYAVTGFPVGLGVGLGVGSGVYNVTGFPVGLGAGINIGAGAYAVTGFSVRLDVGMGVGVGTYVYTGDAVQLIYVPIGPANYVLSIGLGSYVYNGLPVGLTYIPFTPPTGSFTVGGKNVACNYGVSGQGAVFGFSNPVNPFASVVLETDR